ncbi:unnamed protein product [Chrysoparadoxa australica]
MRVALVISLCALCVTPSLCFMMSQTPPSGFQPLTRRGMLTHAAASAVVLPAAAAYAAAAGPPGADRLVRGKKSLDYLLNNWDKETTECKQADGGCARNPDAVRRYLGLRSTSDDLFQIEKVITKGQTYIEDPDDVDAYIEAAEAWESTKSLANSMAYTSSFGEYNPGGGKDQVEKYLEESKKQVIACREALNTIVTILKLEE